VSEISTPKANGPLVGKRALVTGAGSGIGRACAQRLGEMGASIVVADRDEESAAAVGRSLDGEVWIVDLAQTAALETIDLEVDILVNNAGFQHVDPVPEFPPEIFRTMVAVMLEAPFLLVRAALPYMYRRGWGRIVNISSVHGLRASPFKSAYVAAKHGLEGLSKVVALEGAEHGVTSNCICPAYARTPLVEGQIASQAALHGVDEDEVIRTILLREPALKRLVEPEEIASLVAYLCGRDAGFITGASLVMDGGWTSR
jgi:3-hydroxybutyrate dehydrogenase